MKKLNFKGGFLGAAPKRDLIWTPFLSLLLRDILRVYKVKTQTILTPLANSSLYFIIFGLSLGKAVHIHDDFSFLHFIIPGIVAMGILAQSFANGASSIFGMKVTGEIIDLKSTALSPLQIVLAISISGFLRGLIVGGLNLGIGMVFFFVSEGSWLPIQSMALLGVFALLGGLAFASIGLCSGLIAKNFDQIGAVSGLILTPLMYLGGVFFDLEKLSPFWQKASLFNPLFYFVNGVRQSVLGAADVSAGMCLAAALIAAFVSFGLALYAVRASSFNRAF